MARIGGGPTNDGRLTVAVGADGIDAYDFGQRAVLVREIKNELGLGTFEPLPSPRTVEIEPTLICNARCHFCSYESDIAKFRAEVRAKPEVVNGLPKDAVIHLLDALRDGGTTAGTFWSGGGEPLAWPHIVDAIRHAATFCQVSVQTNGIGLDRVMRNPDDLRAIRLLTVSLYADEADLHAEIAGVDSFEKVVSNIRRVRELKAARSLNLTIAGKILVDAKNYRRLPAIVRFYREIGLDVLGLREVQDYNYGGAGQREISVELSAEQKGQLCDVVAASSYQDSALRSFAQTVKTSRLRPTITDHCYNALDGHFACVDARGSVFVGNPEIGDDRFKIGNILEQPWQQIWNGARHREVVQEMDALQIQGMCASALCRHVRANVGVQEYLSGRTGPADRAKLMAGLGAFL